MALTLGEASNLTGISKPTIAKAVNTGKIAGIKNSDTGVYEIEKSELIRVYPEINSKQAFKEKPVQSDEIKTMLINQVSDLERRLSKTQADLEDALKSERAANERAFALLENKMQENPRPKSLWQRILG